MWTKNAGPWRSRGAARRRRGAARRAAADEERKAAAEEKTREEKWIWLRGGEEEMLTNGPGGHGARVRDPNFGSDGACVQ